jgi:hypothetical protein
MADSDNVDYVNGVPRRLGKQTRPGVLGAIKDAGQAIMNSSPDATGSAGRQKLNTVNDAVDDAVTGRMRQAQSTDRDNNYGGQ